MKRFQTLNKSLNPNVNYSVSISVLFRVVVDFQLHSSVKNSDLKNQFKSSQT